MFAPLSVSVPASTSCPRCGAAGIRLEAVGNTVALVHDECLQGQPHRAYAGPVTGLPAASPLALELALAR